MSRPKSLLIVLLIWAAIYLPALGSLAIKGEEGRRILPAMRMLETGNYIVPRVGSNPYLRKPPLVNWLVAASFRFFGTNNEWTARLPSAVAVLAVAIAFVTAARASLGPAGSTIAALMWMTNIGMIEKGRLIEIEAIYVSLCGVAIILWLSFWVQKKSAWLIWITPSFFLGLGLLAKGPIHLVFFYAIVVAVLWQAKDWRLLYHPAHALSIFIMLGIFGAWAIPFLQSTAAQGALSKWSLQFTGRLQGTDFRFVSWIQNIPRALIYFLPWALLLPFIRLARFPSDAQRRLAGGLAWGTALPFVAVNLLPGALPRYSLPALVPASWLLAMGYVADALKWPEWKLTQTQINRARIIAIFIGFAVVVGAIGYPLTAMVLRNRQQIKIEATQINNAVPSQETLYAVDPDYQPVFFYVKAPIQPVDDIANLPAETRYFLVRADDEEKAATTQKWAPLKARAIARAKDYSKREIILFKIEP